MLHKRVLSCVPKFGSKLVLRPIKDRKLLIRVRCTTRKFYLHAPRPGAETIGMFDLPRPGSTALGAFSKSGAKEIGPAKRISAKIIDHLIRRFDLRSADS